MDIFRNEAIEAVTRISHALLADEKNQESIDSLYRLAELLEDGFCELLSLGKGDQYDIPALYGKTENAKKIRILVELLVAHFRGTVEHLIHSAFWRMFAEDPATPKETVYAAAVVLYGLSFAFSRTVGCPEDWWYKTEDQHLPLLNAIAIMASGENAQLRALLSGAYSLLSSLVFDGARQTFTFGEANIMINGHLERLEYYLSSRVGAPQKPSAASTVRQLQLMPLSLDTEARFLAEFLSSFGSYPHIRNDPIKRMLEQNFSRILDLTKLTLQSWSIVDHSVAVPIIKLTANMIKACPVFAKTFAEDANNWKALLLLPLDSRVSVHVSHCLSELLTPKFWCTGDPVGARIVLGDYLDCLEIFRKVNISTHEINHLRAAGAVEIFEMVLGDRRAFDPFRSRGKEEAIEKCGILIQAIRLTVCDILLSMAKSSHCRRFFVNASLFCSPKIIKNLSDANGNLEVAAAKFLRCLYSFPTSDSDLNLLEHLASKNLPNSNNHQADMPLETCLKSRLLKDDYNFWRWNASCQSLRGLDSQLAFQRTRKLLVIPIRSNTGDVVSSTFVGAADGKVMLRTSMGHLMYTDLRSRKTIFSIHDWTHNDEKFIRSLPFDSSRFLATSTDLVTDTDSKKSHLWGFRGNMEGCSPLAEYNNIQFLRPSCLYSNMAVGHAPVWRRKNGCYFVLDMETKRRIVPLGPLHEEENHPNFPSFHPTADIVICMGTIWDCRSGDPIHRFDRIRTKANCVENLFHADGTSVLIDDQIWDLRTYGLIRRVKNWEGVTRLQFSSTGSVLVGQKKMEAAFDDMTFYDSRNYSTISQVPINGRVSHISIDRMDYHIIVCRRNGFPLLLEVG